MKQPKPEQYHEKKRHTEDQFPYNTYLAAGDFPGLAGAEYLGEAGRAH